MKQTMMSEEELELFQVKENRNYDDYDNNFEWLENIIDEIIKANGNAILWRYTNDGMLAYSSVCDEHGWIKMHLTNVKIPFTKDYFYHHMMYNMNINPDFLYIMSDYNDICCGVIEEYSI